MNRPTLQILFGAATISFAAVIVRLTTVPPTVSGFYRLLFASLALAAILFAKRTLPVLSPRSLLLSALAGAVFAFDLFFWHRSVHAVGPGLATLLGNFQVFILASFGVLILKERFTLKLASSIIMALCGLYLVVAEDWTSSGAAFRTGVAYGLATALCYAAYILLMRSARSYHRASPIAMMFVICLSGAAVLAGSAGLEGVSLALPGVGEAALLALYGIGCQVLGWVTIATATPSLPAGVIGLSLLVQPALSFLWDVLFFARPTSPVEYSGVAVTLTAILIGSISSRRH